MRHDWEFIDLTFFSRGTTEDTAGTLKVVWYWGENGVVHPCLVPVGSLCWLELWLVLGFAGDEGL